VECRMRGVGMHYAGDCHYLERKTFFLYVKCGG